MEGTPYFRTMQKIFFLLFVFLSTQLFSQTSISGLVTDSKGAPLAGVNIFIKDSYDGATSGGSGRFDFETEDTGKAILVASFMSFETVEKEVVLNGAMVTFNPVMKAAINQLKVVVISAGTIEASDEKKVTVLKPLDIVTTATAQGDIYGALKTLPGTQQVGESEGLFVRGGSGNETQTIIDGMYVAHPFYSSVPDIAQRGRFSPFLFKGTVFSTGGYSAQYGEAMSSVLVLESQDMPDKSQASLALTSVGVGGGLVELMNKK